MTVELFPYQERVWILDLDSQSGPSGKTSSFASVAIRCYCFVTVDELFAPSHRSVKSVRQCSEQALFVSLAAQRSFHFVHDLSPHHVASSSYICRVSWNGQNDTKVNDNAFSHVMSRDRNFSIERTHTYRLRREGSSCSTGGGYCLYVLELDVCLSIL